MDFTILNENNLYLECVLVDRVLLVLVPESLLATITNKPNISNSILPSPPHFHIEKITVSVAQRRQGQKLLHLTQLQSQIAQPTLGSFQHVSRDGKEMVRRQSCKKILICKFQKKKIVILPITQNHKTQTIVAKVMLSFVSDELANSLFFF